MFSRLAWRYDLVNDVMSFGLHRRWKRQTVELALSRRGTPRPGARPLLRQRRPLLPGRGPRRRQRHGRRLHAADARRRAAARRSRRRAAAASSRPTRCALPFADGALRRHHDQLRPAQHRRHPAARSPRCAACSRRAAAPSSSTSASRTTPLAGALYRAFLRTMMPVVGWLFHGDPETYLYIPESLERYPAQRGVEKLMRRPASRTCATRTGCSGRWGSTSARRPLLSRLRSPV